MARSSWSTNSVLRTLPLLIVVVFTAACASLPPAKQVTSVDQIAGKWQGTVSTPGGPLPATTTINADGNYSAVVGSTARSGQITLVNGKLRAKSDQTGATGTYSLHEGEGRRVLIYSADDGSVRSEYTPAK